MKASLLLVVRPGAPSSVLAPSSDALVTTSEWNWSIFTKMLQFLSLATQETMSGGSALNLGMP